MTDSPATRVLVVGIGNEYRGDDAVGFAVTRSLRTDLGTSVDIQEFEGDGAGLMQLWAGYDAVIIVDCITARLPVGSVIRLDAATHKVPTHYFRSSSHLFGVAEAVEMARTLGELPPTLLVYGVTGHTFEAGSPLSAEVETSVADVVSQIKRDLAAF